ncbi:uncharacterized protein LOC119832885 [Zerene cesonia]|uniref:uncharacterized protein LOC119832885 n=1 Tax=Zerene cesonia TaxID=33412 RepID=UPI0018E53E87|nr:uncharacterized protein LOC119832885 [Zerene cesonia]
MGDESVLNVKCRILDLISELGDHEVQNIEEWITSQSYRKDLEQKRNLQRSEKQLIKIANTLRKIVPFEAEMTTEKIEPPTVGDQADCTKENTCHVDEFLYDDKHVDELVKSEKLTRFYCSQCNSRKTKELIFISHSMSRQALQYIFTVLLPKDLEDKKILDVGSRLGAVLYGAYYFSNASTIVGVEMNKELCEIQENVIKKYSMDANRIKVVHADIMERNDIVECSNIIIINVLDFFVDIEKHKDMWYFFKKHIKKGSYLVSNRSMADTLNSLDIYEDMIGWLNICKPNQIENEIFFDLEDYNELYLYTVN